MRVLIDMNLSPEWQVLLTENHHEATHWSAIGVHNVPDAVIMQWARDHNWIVFTNDLDFGILLAHSREGRPSVIQARTNDVSPEHLGPIVLSAIQIHRQALELGALLTIDEARFRIRILPL